MNDQMRLDAIKRLQTQYRTLYRATEMYLDGQMPANQMAALEQAAAEFIGVVVQNRLAQALITAMTVPAP